jgi:hypothetical protein
MAEASFPLQCELIRVTDSGYSGNVDPIDRSFGHHRFGSKGQQCQAICSLARRVV